MRHVWEVIRYDVNYRLEMQWCYATAFLLLVDFDKWGYVLYNRNTFEKMDCFMRYMTDEEDTN